LPVRSGISQVCTQDATYCLWQCCQQQPYDLRVPSGERRNPDWTWDEIVLACDLVFRNGGHALPAEDPRVVELSKLLQQMSIHPKEGRREDFRNTNGVGRKTADIATALPGYTGKPTNGGRLDKDVIAQFLADQDTMRALAESIRSSVANGEPDDFPGEVGYDGESEMEGRYLLRWHAYRERNPALRRRKLASVVAAGDPLVCEVCQFDFSAVYGDRGRGYIECHHVEPLHVGGERARTINDLALLCSNCHRMIHTKPPWPTPAELRDVIRQHASGRGGER
jgi:5-methylcytosine-specific restriction enzyme A